MRFLLDTSTYLRILRDAEYARAAEPALRRIAPRLHLCSVVRAELTQGARGPEGRALVGRLVRRLERTGRTVAPTHGDWSRAGTVQSLLWDGAPGLRARRMLPDLLIACCARRVGAVVITDNERDFASVDRWLRTERLRADDLPGV